MKNIVSFQELDALGEGLSRDYAKKKHSTNMLCFDIEGFITEYLGLPIVYENFAEDDKGKLGFLANGIDPLLVFRQGKRMMVVFPKDTVVIDKYLLKSTESSRRRFTLAHEAAHKILERHAPMQAAASFRSDYDAQMSYTKEDLSRMFSLNETLANRLAAAILMPAFLMEKTVKKYNNSQPLRYYEGGVFSQEDKLKAQKMADSLGVSFSAFINRMREFNMLEWHPIEEYIHAGLQFGGGL